MSEHRRGLRSFPVSDSGDTLDDLRRRYLDRPPEPPRTHRRYLITVLVLTLALVAGVGCVIANWTLAVALFVAGSVLAAGLMIYVKLLSEDVTIETETLE